MRAVRYNLRGLRRAVVLVFASGSYKFSGVPQKIISKGVGKKGIDKKIENPKPSTN
jgi:hypothetical protein